MRVLAVLVLVLAPALARADLAIGPETHVPWSLGGRLEWRPLPVLAPSISVGYVPPFYVEQVAKFIEDDDVETLVVGAVERSLVLVPRLTVNPVGGLTVSGGVRWYLLGGGFDAGDALRAAIPELRALPDVSDRRIEVDARPLLLEGGLGWRFGLGPVELLLEGGWTQTVSVEVEVDGVSGVPRQLAEDYLVDVFHDHVYGPYLAVGVFVVL